MKMGYNDNHRLSRYLEALEDLEEHPEELVLQELRDGLETEQKEDQVVYHARPGGSRTIEGS